MLVLPDPPDSLPAAPRTFYETLRATVQELRPADIAGERAEVDFGDAGVAVTLPHRHREDSVLTAQVSRRAAVVFAGPQAKHFSGGEDWVGQAAAFVERVLRGDHEIELAYRGDRLVRVGGERLLGWAALMPWRPVRTERLRLDFGAEDRRSGGN